MIYIYIYIKKKVNYTLPTQNLCRFNNTYLWFKICHFIQLKLFPLQLCNMHLITFTLKTQKT